MQGGTDGATIRQGCMAWGFHQGDGRASSPDVFSAPSSLGVGRLLSGPKCSAGAITLSQSLVRLTLLQEPVGVIGDMEREVFKRACAQGGEDMRLAFRQLYQDYGRALLRECSLCLRDPEAARDALQNALLRIWKSCASYRGDSELFPWLKRVARSVAIDELRASAVRPPSSHSLAGGEQELDPALPDGLPGPEALTATRLALERYRECEARFQAADPEAAAVIRWIAEDELSIEDVARLLNRTPQATRQYLYQCRRKARHYLAPWYAEVAGGEG
ncbi:MAG: hypothetical protein CFE41_03065 [Burkholderiales bacterium PBB2]|nr:MAG: hypothetical protein CFE41_03065 [Burkholderiales bacterium PBB2]